MRESIHKLHIKQQKKLIDCILNFLMQKKIYKSNVFTNHYFQQNFHKTYNNQWNSIDHDNNSGLNINVIGLRIGRFIISSGK